MDNNSKNCTCCGEITIFLTLILLILLSFFSVAIQSARMSALYGFSERNLRLAVQGVFSEYCRPLWEEYHLFMLEGDGDLNARLLSEVEKYQSEITGNLYKQEDRSFEITSMTPFLNEGGENYINQLTAYMKYHVADSQLFDKKNKMEEIKGEKKKVKEQINKIEETEWAADIDKSLLKVIKLVDGIVISDGKVKTERSFVKQIFPGETEEINSSAVGITNNAIWEALKSEYIPYEEVSVSKCRKIVCLINEALKEINQMEQNELAASSKNLNCMYYQAVNMKGTLVSNREVLELYLQNRKDKNAGDILKSYQIRPLHFNYGKLNLKEKIDPIKSIKKSFHSNLLSLVIESENTVSKKKLPIAFSLAESSKESKDFSSKTLSKINRKDSKQAKNCFGSFVNNTLEDNSLKTILEIEYYQQHFSNYLSKENKLFQYEQEFIIGGGKTEQEALENVLDKLLLQRGILNFLYLLTDKEKSNEAHLTAVALVGFSGMEALVEVVKTTILLCWAMAEAVIDIAILLQGKELSLCKTKQSFLLSYEDLFVFGKSLVLEKAKEYKEVHTASNTYEDYLKLLLFLQNKQLRINRSLALIEETMKQTYYQDFSMSEGITGICIEARYNYYKNNSIKANVDYSY